MNGSWKDRIKGQMPVIDIIISKGFPATGKSTFFNQMEKDLKKQDMFYTISGDDIRTELAKEHGLTYDDTFTKPIPANEMVEILKSDYGIICDESYNPSHIIKIDEVTKLEILTPLNEKEAEDLKNKINSDYLLEINKKNMELYNENLPEDNKYGKIKLLFQDKYWEPKIEKKIIKDGKEVTETFKDEDGVELPVMVFDKLPYYGFEKLDIIQNGITNEDGVKIQLGISDIYNEKVQNAINFNEKLLLEGKEPKTIIVDSMNMTKSSINGIIESILSGRDRNLTPEELKLRSERTNITVVDFKLENSTDIDLVKKIAVVRGKLSDKTIPDVVYDRGLSDYEPASVKDKYIDKVIEKTVTAKNLNNIFDSLTAKLSKDNLTQPRIN